MLLILNASAQNTGSDSIVVLKGLEKMKNELDLNQHQVDTLKSILFDNYEKNQMFEKNIVIVRGVQKQNDESTEYTVSKILTQEQYKLYLKNKEIRKAQKKDLKIREKMAFYRQELKLTDQQYTDLKSLIEKTLTQRDGLKETYKNDDAMFKAEMKKVKKAFQEQLKKVLNKEQLVKYKEIHNTGKP